MISAADREIARAFGRALAADIKADRVNGSNVVAMVPKKKAQPKLRMAKASLRSTADVKREA